MSTWTKRLQAGESFTVNKSMNAMRVAVMVLAASSGTMTGNYKVAGAASDTLTLPEGSGFTLPADSPAAPLDGITFGCDAGTVNLVFTF